MKHPAEILEAQLDALLAEATASVPPTDPEAPVRPGSRLTGAKLVELFESQLTSRMLDLAARDLRQAGKGFYTIASSGHEANAVLGDLLRPTDPKFLHYRSGALVVQHARQAPEVDAVRDAVLSMAASSEDPVSGGRHKVWGCTPLWIVPQTSTIASHLPKAVGCAMGIDSGRRLGLDMPVDEGAVVLCSFGDASLNHSTAQGALNTAGWMARHSVPTPVLFLCEDNGWGISTRTPGGWVEARMRPQPGVRYFQADGLDLAEAYDTAQQALDFCRQRRAPAFLHLKVVRLMGHAGSDVEHVYRKPSEIQETLAKDPVLATARTLLERGLRTPEQLRDLVAKVAGRVKALAEEAGERPRLRTVDEIAAPMAPSTPDAVRAEAARGPGLTPRSERPMHLAGALNRALREALTRYPQTQIFGEDVARKGGVYGVTSGLWRDFGTNRVFNTILDEQAILGVALGTAHVGFLPMPEIQYLAYLHNALDQLRSEACSLQFFSNDQFRNPMVVRVAAYGYQKGFGGHFHNDNSIAALRDIPGLILASPARAGDAVRMLRSCLASAKVDGRVVVFLEPIARYSTKDLHDEGDGGWMDPYPELDDHVPVGAGRVYHEDAPDLTIATYANGLWLSLRAAKTLHERHGLRARVVDLRWLAPLDHDLVAEHAKATGKLLVVDECRRSGAVAEAVAVGAIERCGRDLKIGMVTASDTYVPLGPAMDLVLPCEDEIVAAAKVLTGVEEQP